MIMTKELELEVSEILKDLGISCDLTGYVYLQDAIKIVYESDKPEKLSVCKDIYSKIAEKHNSTESKVERAMRHSINIGVLYGNNNTYFEYFKYSMRYDKHTITNSQFIYTIAYKLKFKNN